MTGQSDFKPQPFTVNDLTNGMAEIMIYEKVAEFESVDFEQNIKIMYEFEMYEIVIPQRDGLVDDIEINYTEWLAYAKGQTGKPLSDKEKIQLLETNNALLLSKTIEIEDRTMMAENVLLDLMME